MKKTIIAPSAVVQVNGPRQQKGVDALATPRLPEPALRKLDHPEWLENFAKVMQMKAGLAMTPMRAGVINRALFAAEYIRLLRHDVKKALHDLDLAMVEIDRLKSLATKLEETLDDH